MPREPFKKISIAHMAQVMNITLAEAQQTAREMRDGGLMDLSLDEMTCWFLPRGIEVAQDLKISEQMKETERRMF